jgi:hypothetical protein
MQITVEIELPEDKAKKLEALIENRTLDREKFLKKLLTDSIHAQIEKREAALARIARTKAVQDA